MKNYGNFDHSRPGLDVQALLFSNIRQIPSSYLDGISLIIKIQLSDKVVTVGLCA